MLESPRPGPTDVHDLIRDTAADLGLGLVRIQADHRRIEDVFADEEPATSKSASPDDDPRRRSVIHDLGYRPYTGPRLGEGRSRALVLTGFRNAFGLGRSAKSKALPFILLALNLFPAVIMVGVLVLTGADELPIAYASTRRSRRYCSASSSPRRRP